MPYMEVTQACVLPFMAAAADGQMRLHEPAAARDEPRRWLVAIGSVARRGGAAPAGAPGARRAGAAQRAPHGAERRSGAELSLRSLAPSSLIKNQYTGVTRAPRSYHLITALQCGKKASSAPTSRLTVPHGPPFVRAGLAFHGLAPTSTA